MDIIQQIMLIFTELIEKITAIFSFISSQFLPSTDGESDEEIII